MVDTDRVFRGCGIVVVVLAAVVCTAAVALVAGLHYALRPADVEGDSRSPELRSARAAAIAQQHRALATLFAGAPVLAESIEDRCDPDVGMGGGRGFTSCFREVVRYVAVDDDRGRSSRPWVDTGQRGVSVRTGWTERPTVPPVGRDFDRGVASPRYDNQVILEERPVDRAAVYREAYGEHRYVVAVTVHTRYYPPT